MNMDMELFKEVASKCNGSLIDGCLNQLGQLHTAVTEQSERIKQLEAENEQLIIYKNLADEYGLSVFADLAELQKQRDELLAAIEKMLDALVISVPMAFAAAIQNMDIDDAEEIHAIGAALAEEIPDDGRTVRETLRFLTTALSIAQSTIASVKGGAA